MLLATPAASFAFHYNTSPIRRKRRLWRLTGQSDLNLKCDNVSFVARRAKWEGGKGRGEHPTLLREAMLRYEVQAANRKRPITR